MGNHMISLMSRGSGGSHAYSAVNKGTHICVCSVSPIGMATWLIIWSSPSCQPVCQHDEVAPRNRHGQEGRIARMLNETRQKVAMLGLLHLQFCDPTAHWKVLSSGLDQNVWTS